MVKLGATLMIICLAASLVLALTYKLTFTRIEELRAAQEKEALEGALAEADSFARKKIGRFDYYEGFKDKNLIGYVLKVRGSGYSGNIDMLVGIGDKGEIKGIEVLSQQETPGMGARITEIKRGEKKPWFLEQFKEKIAASLRMRDIRVISCATISSRAILEAVKKDVKEFMAGI